MRERFGSKYVVYNVHLNNEYICSRRYNEFNALHNELRRMFLRFDFPEFPKKWLFSKSSVVEERRYQFDYYLKTVLKARVIQQSDIVQKFLKRDESRSRKDTPNNLMPTKSDQVQSESTPRPTGAPPAYEKDPAYEEQKEENEFNYPEAKLKLLEEAFEQGKLPIFTFLSNQHEIIKYSKVLDDDTVADLKSHINATLSLPSDLENSFAIFQTNPNSVKLAKLSDTTPVQALLDEETPILFARYGVFDDMLLQNDTASSLLLAEHSTRPQFRAAKSIESIKDDPSFDAWEFEPCKCELRTDGSLMQLIIDPAQGIVTKLCGTDNKLVIDWDHVISG